MAETNKVLISDVDVETIVGTTANAVMAFDTEGEDTDNEGFHLIAIDGFATAENVNDINAKIDVITSDLSVTDSYAQFLEGRLSAVETIAGNLNSNLESLSKYIDTQLEDCVKFNSDNNVQLREETKILSMSPNGNAHEILGLNEYEVSITEEILQLGADVQGLTIKFNNQLGKIVPIPPLDGSPSYNFYALSPSGVIISFVLSNNTITYYNGMVSTAVNNRDGSPIIESVTFPSGEPLIVTNDNLTRMPASTDTQWGIDLARLIYEQVEVGSTALHLNLNTNTDPLYPERVTVDTQGNGKQTIAYINDISSSDVIDTSSTFGSIGNVDDTLDFYIGDSGLILRGQYLSGTTSRMYILTLGESILASINRQSFYDGSPQYQVFNNQVFTDTPINIDDSIYNNSNDTTTLNVVAGEDWYIVRYYVAPISDGSGYNMFISYIKF